MGKKKSETTNSYTYMTPPSNANYDTAKQYIEGYDGGAGSIREGYARNINAIKESAQGNQFYGGNTSPELKDKMRDSRLFRNNLELGRGLADAKQNEIAYKNQAYMGLGSATAPQLVQSGGVNTQTGFFAPAFSGAFGSAFGGGLGSAA